LNNAAYSSQATWHPERPHILVIACSDGRLQESVDDFLHEHLGVGQYDRLYMPGGPGALAQSGQEILRSDQWRRESLFLLDVHDIREVVLIFHAAANDGPEGANCADYARKLPTQPMSHIRTQQEEDAVEVVQQVFSGSAYNAHPVSVRVFRAEVRADYRVQFVEMMAAEQPAEYSQP
jgi:hypothetical protein